MRDVFRKESAVSHRAIPDWISHLSCQIRTKCFDPLRAETTIIRKKEDGPDCTVSDN